MSHHVSSALELLRSVNGTIIGWEPRNSRALWRLFVRYMVLTAYRQLQRRTAGPPMDSFSASTASFRQTSTLVTASRRQQRRSDELADVTSSAVSIDRSDIALSECQTTHDHVE